MLVASPPIDCPLHAKGVSADGLRPFAETEQYIAFLERPDRARWQKPDEVVAALHLGGTETVADVGAGSGYFTFRFAKALPKGKVVATGGRMNRIDEIYGDVFDHHSVIYEFANGVRLYAACIALKMLLTILSCTWMTTS